MNLGSFSDVHGLGANRKQELLFVTGACLQIEHKALYARVLVGSLFA